MSEQQIVAASEDGASAVEYGLLIAGIAALVVAIVFIFGDMVGGVFGGTCESIKDGSNPKMILTCA